MFKYFNESDFINAHPSCRIEQMNTEFIHLLDKAREIAGIPFIINSAYRSVNYEKGIGRKGTSSHTKGIAVDIRASDSTSRFKIMKALMDVGINRIGIAKTFIHADIDKEKPQEVLWDY